VNDYREKELALIMSFVSTEIIRVPNLSVFDLVSLGRYSAYQLVRKIARRRSSHCGRGDKIGRIARVLKPDGDYISDGERQKAMIARTWRKIPM